MVENGWFRGVEMQPHMAHKTK